MWVLGIEPEFSAKAATVLNLWAIPSAPNLLFSDVSLCWEIGYVPFGLVSSDDSSLGDHFGRNAGVCHLTICDTVFSFVNSKWECVDTFRVKGITVACSLQAWVQIK